jgi:hypothetical protein
MSTLPHIEPVDMPPLVPGNQDEFANTVDTTTLKTPSDKIIKEVVNLLEFAFSKADTGKKLIKSVNSILDHFAKENKLQSANYETIQSRDMYSYKLIALWESMAMRDADIMEVPE